MSDKKPCGEFHPLPCGLDVECPVPMRYFEAEQSNEETVARWEQ